MIQQNQQQIDWTLQAIKWELIKGEDYQSNPCKNVMLDGEFTEIICHILSSCFFVDLSYSVNPCEYVIVAGSCKVWKCNYDCVYSYLKTMLVY